MNKLKVRSKDGTEFLEPIVMEVCGLFITSRNDLLYHLNHKSGICLTNSDKIDRLAELAIQLAIFQIGGVNLSDIAGCELLANAQIINDRFIEIIEGMSNLDGDVLDRLVNHDVQKRAVDLESIWCVKGEHMKSTLNDQIEALLDTNQKLITLLRERKEDNSPNAPKLMLREDGSFSVYYDLNGVHQIIFDSVDHNRLIDSIIKALESLNAATGYIEQDFIFDWLAVLGSKYLKPLKGRQAQS